MDNFKKIINQYSNILKNKTVILGFSGGPDSVYLYELLKKMHNQKIIKLICAHLNHEWRSNASEDADFCRKKCEHDNIKIIIGKASKLKVNIKFNGSKEEVGRILRLNFFDRIMKEENANFIATAHHLGDQEETFIWRIIRGTTLSGLSLMQNVNGKYVKPLLDIPKKEILSYLKNKKISYITDQTNSSDAYLRNRIRKYVIPALKKVDPRFEKKFATTIKHLQEENDFLEKLVKTKFNAIFSESNKINLSFIGNLKLFNQQDTVIQKRILILLLSKNKHKFNISDNFLKEMLRFIKSERGGTHQLTRTIRIVKKGTLFWIE